MMSATVAFGQITSQSGAITGTVIDQSGAVVPNAKVTLSSDKGVTTTQTTGETGDFTFPLLPAGTYAISVEASGFSKAIVSSVMVQVTQTTKVPVTLEVGAATAEVSVSAQATLVNPTNATLGNTLPGTVIENMPLATRNFTNLLASNASTSSALPNAAASGRGSGTVYVNGQRGTYNNLVINGIDANNLGNNNFGNVAIPAPDTIEEFRVQTSLYDASQGKTSGGNINVITKGGFPQYHGQAYEFFRNNVLNANSWFFNKTTTPRPVLKQNQFGGNFGGPVPKLQKTFFFASYQGTRQRNGLSGAISGLFPVLPAQRTRANIENAFNMTAGSLDPVALNLLNAKGVYNGYLIPTGVGAAPGTFGNITVSAPLSFTDNQFNADADHQFSDKHRITLRYFRSAGETFDPFGGQGAASLGSGLANPQINHLASISSTYTFTANLFNEARLGFSRNVGGNIPAEPVSLSDVGMSRFNGSLFPGIPYIVTADPIPNFGGISTNYDQRSATNTYHFSDTLAWVRGRHSVRVGFEYRRYQINLFNNFASRGYLQFNSFADFLKGGPIVISFAGTGITYRDFRARDAAAYVQDDYKLSRRITLNLGLRYDYLGPSVDRLDRNGNFDPSLLDANTLANGGAGLAAGFLLPSSFKSSTIQGTPGVDRSTLTTRNPTNFAPRVGVAWDVFGDGRTAVRAGYGIYYVRISNQTLLQLITAAPFFQLSNLTNPGTTLANPFPNLPLPSAFPALPQMPAFTGYSATGSPLFSAPLLTINPIQRNMGTPYAQHYNLTIQHQLPKEFNVELGYVGSQGVRLLQSAQLNQALLANSNAPIRGLTANASANANARVRVAGFSPSGMNAVTDNGHSSFNALVLTVNRRLASMFVQAAYTFSKSLDNNSGSATQDLGPTIGNQLVPSLARGLSDFDRTHRLQITYSYNLPGYGNGWLKYALGNWSIGGLTTYQSALPIAFTCSACSYTVYGFTSSLSPDVIGDFSNLSKGGDPRNYLDAGKSIFNTGILSAPNIFTAGQVLAVNMNPQGGPGNQTYTVGGTGTATFRAQLFGSLPRNPGLRGPFQQQWDFYVAKVIPIREKVKLRFDAQFFNLFNHPVFSAPASAVGSSSFGRISSTQTQPRIIQLAGRIEF